MRRWVDSICVLSGAVGTFLIRKGFDVGFFIIRDPEFPVRGKFGGDPVENWHQNECH